MVFYNGADVKAGTRWIFSGPKRALVARILVSLFSFADKREDLKYALATRQNSVKLFVFFPPVAYEKPRIVLFLIIVGWVS